MFRTIAGTVRAAGFGCAGLVGALVVTLGTGVGVSAEPPVELSSDGQVTDPAELLTGTELFDLEAALDALRGEDDVQLFVVFVESFDGMGSQEWVDETARINGLGLNDVLLAVATEDRQYAYSVDEDFPLDDRELDRIAVEDIEPALTEGDWDGAGIAAANAYRSAIGSASDDGRGVGWILVPAAAVVVGGGYLWYRRRRPSTDAGGPGPGAAGPPPDPLDGLDEDELTQRGSSLLVEVDDAIKTSESDLNVAEVEFGPEAVAPFREALAAARSEITAAFNIRVRIQDGEVPEGERRALLVEVIERAEQADGILDDQAEAFAELRDRAARAPEIIEAVKARLSDAEAKLPSVEATLAELTAAYPVSALGEVADNATEVRERIEFARTEVAEGVAAVTANDGNAAALASQAAEEALQQVDTLVQAVDRAGADLEQAKAALPARIDSLRQDVAEAEAAADAASPVVAGAASVARQVLAEIEPQLADPALDPVGAVARLAAAETELDEALAPLRDQLVREDKARAMLADAVTAAQSRVAAVEDFVTTRRGGIGVDARTKLAEAGRYLEAARSTAESDPEAALQAAQRAVSTADEAGRLAEADVAEYQRAPYGGGGGGSRGGGLGGMVLGGILLDSILRGGRGGGYSGGGGGVLRPSGGGGGSRRSGGGTRSGRFGGSGRRRGGGGRF